MFYSVYVQHDSRGVWTIESKISIVDQFNQMMLFNKCKRQKEIIIGSQLMLKTLKQFLRNTQKIFFVRDEKFHWFFVLVCLSLFLLPCLYCTCSIGFFLQTKFSMVEKNILEKKVLKQCPRSLFLRLDCAIEVCEKEAIERIAFPSLPSDLNASIRPFARTVCRRA